MSRAKKLLAYAKQLKMELKGVKKKSTRRKKHLRDINQKLERYISVADAAISDAARWKAESEMWKDRYFTELEKRLNAEQES